MQALALEDMSLKDQLVETGKWPDFLNEMAKRNRENNKELVSHGLKPRKLEDVIRYDWSLNARPKQRMPNNGKGVVFACCGRGFGKTHMGANNTIEYAWKNPGAIICIMGKNYKDCRRVMIEGKSGIIKNSPPWFEPHYEPAKGQITWPNGSIAYVFTSDAPDDVVGYQYNFAWVDELCKWKNSGYVWEMLEFCVRLEDFGDPLVLITSTPRVNKTILDIIQDEDTHLIRGSMYENQDNLSKKFLSKMQRKYEGTSIGKQEIHAEILLEVTGALWTLDMIDGGRKFPVPEEGFSHVFIGVDPQIEEAKRDIDTNMTGIVVVGIRKIGDIYHYWVLDDMSKSGSPITWAKQVNLAYERYQADKVVFEKNQGGQMGPTILKGVNPNIVIDDAYTGKRGKRLRAEPVSALYEQGRVHHTRVFDELEQEQTQWSPETSKYSPDRLDALCWAIGRHLDSEDQPDFCLI